MNLRNLRDFRTPLLERLQKSPFRAITIFVERVTANKRTFYSIYGEDAIIMGIMDRYTMHTGKRIALNYIDIGAWRPIRGSNTYFLYKMGCTGTVVEPNPHFKKIWEAVRPRDTYLAIGCGFGKSADLQIFHPGAASNTFSLNFAQEISATQSHKVKNSITVPLKSLKEIISEHVSDSDLPFILDIDIEGMDYEVISSYDFPRGLRPIIILIEDKPPLGDSQDASLIENYLNFHNYRLIARTVVTAVYIDNSSNLSF
jgi:FkbM family methyltransferase